MHAVQGRRPRLRSRQRTFMPRTDIPLESAVYTEGHRQQIPARADLLTRLESVGLTNRQSVCLSLYYFDGLTQDEIGRHLGIGQRAVCQHLKYGHKKLLAASLRPRRVRTTAQPTMTLMDIQGIDLIALEAIRSIW